MNGFLVKYAAILAKARADINDLMEKPSRPLKRWPRRTIFDSIPRREHPSEFGFDSHDIHLGFYRFLDSFIRTGDAVCHEATEAVHHLINDTEHGILYVRRG